MIKINLLAERKQSPKAASTGAAKTEGLGGSQNLLLVGILLLGLLVAGGWWWTLSNSLGDLRQKHAEADRELARLAEIRKKGDEYKRKKELLVRQIDLITKLKRQQDVPVHILDQVSKNLPEFLWLESMNVTNNQINLNGKATTYQAVTNFYNNLKDSGYFANVTMGRVFEVQEGVSFSLTCRFSALDAPPQPVAGDTESS